MAEFSKFLLSVAIFLALSASVPVLAQPRSRTESVCSKVMEAMAPFLSSANVGEAYELFLNLQNTAPRFAAILVRLFDHMTVGEIRDRMIQLQVLSLEECTDQECIMAGQYNNLSMHGFVFFDSSTGELTWSITELLPSKWINAKLLVRAGLAFVSLTKMKKSPKTAKVVALVKKLLPWSLNPQNIASLRPVLADLMLGNLLLIAKYPEEIRSIRIQGRTLINRSLYNLLIDSGFEDAGSSMKHLIQKGRAVVGLNTVNFFKWWTKVWAISQGAAGWKVKNYITPFKLLPQIPWMRVYTARDVELIVDFDGPAEETSTPLLLPWTPLQLPPPQR